MNKYITYFYFLSFLEGASVMAAELLGAKMLAPYFGTSLYVWSSVLGVTLGGLALGYFAGGVVSGKQQKEKYLYYILLASAVFLMMMPFLAKAVMLHTSGFGLLTSVLISTLVFLFPPVFFMGMVSPLIVECIASFSGAGDRSQGSGKTAGTVYAISTLGGILSTFFLGFYVIPVFGLTNPSIFTGILMGVIPFFMLISKKNFFSLLMPLAIFFSLSSSRPFPEGEGVKIHYSSEGLLGQIIVGDYPLYEDGSSRAVGTQRILFVNRSTQTIVTDKKGQKGYFEYVNVILDRTFDSMPGQQALVLGLGGGSVANMLTENGYLVEAVELDARMAAVAKEYFELSGKVNVHIDDARHFVVGLKSKDMHRKKYKVIVLDAFIGEVNPHHLFTQEFFREIRNLLADDGAFFINGNGYWNGEVGRGMRSVCKTLIHSGFNTEVVPTQEEEDYRNLVFVAKKCDEDIGSMSTVSLNDISHDAVVLVDDKPQLEILNSEANRRWREGCMKYFVHSYYSKQDMLLFR